MTISENEILVSRKSLHQFIGSADKLMDGATILMDKERGWTSFDVVNKIRKIFGIKKVGHSGTLDPMATGLLIVCTGRMTKAISRYTGLDKEYRGTFKLGEITSSYDSETEVVEKHNCFRVTESQIINKAAEFTGRIEQVPPMYSAIKQKGRPLYLLARRGIEVERAPRQVQVNKFDITEVKLPLVKFSVLCTKGTYIRSLVNDLGLSLGVGAHLTELRRIGIGEFSVSEAVKTEEIADLIQSEKVQRN